MRVGIMFANAGPFGTAEGCTAIATHAEAAGFDALWTVEHVVFPEAYQSAYPYDDSGKMAMASDTPLTDPLIWLTWAAAHTTRLRLATGILILPERNPVVLAKELGTLDAMSGGRVDLGIGVGWLREEFDALGIPWERRAARTDEYVAAMRTLWSGDRGVVRRRVHVVRPGVEQPKARQRIRSDHRRRPQRGRRPSGRPPGRRLLPAKGDLDVLLDAMHREAEAHDRDPTDIEVIWGRARASWTPLPSTGPPHWPPGASPAW